MHSQPDLKEIVVTSKAGKQVTIEQLPATLTEILEDTPRRAQYISAGEAYVRCLANAPSPQSGSRSYRSHSLFSHPLK